MRDWTNLKILLVGGGGHCLSCVDVIETLDHMSIAGIADPRFPEVTELHGYPVLGDDSHFQQLAQFVDGFVIAIGQLSDPSPRTRVYAQLKSIGAQLVSVVAPSSMVSARATIGEGSVVMNFAFINAGALIGRNCIVNSRALVEHGSVIGDHCHISTGAIINGDVVVGDRCFIGSGAIVREGVSIGAGAIIGAGARIGEDVEPGGRVMGQWSPVL